MPMHLIARLRDLASLFAVRGRAAVALVLALVVGISSSAAGAAVWGHRERDGQRVAFRASARGVSATLATLIGRDSAFVASLGTVMRLQPSLQPSGFERWYAALKHSQRQVGGLGSGVLKVVPAGELGAFQARRDADPGFVRAFGDRLVPVAVSGRGRYCLLGSAGISERDNERFAPVMQQDWCDPHTVTGAAQARLLMGAAASGGLAVYPVLTGPVSTTLLERPYYRTATQPRTAAQRRRAVAGWVVSSIDMPRLLRQAIGSDEGIALRLSFRNGDGTSVAVAALGAARGPYRLRSTPDIDGRWTIAVAGGPPVRGLPVATQEAIILGTGATITLLLVALVVSLVRSRERALTMVAQRTGQLRHQALHDALTGLPNRVLAVERIADALADERSVALLYIDVDGFKQINDSFGHAVGDRFLAVVGERLRSVARRGDTAARLAGDEFVLVVPDMDEAEAARLAARVLGALRRPFDLPGGAGRSIVPTASIGLAVGASASAESLLADADAALYEAKRAGRDRCVVFDPEMLAAVQDRAALEMDLTDALERGELSLHYQPVFDLHHRRLSGVEALMRWTHPHRGVVGPDRFIPIAEQSDLIVELGRWALRTACEQAVRWREQGYALYLGVNVSRRQLDSDAFLVDVEEALARSGLEPRALNLEITETALGRDAAGAIARLHALRELGVGIAIDDFGTGYSSMGALHELPVNVLKIDRTFVSGIDRSAQKAALVAAIGELARNLDLHIVGEGIETEAELAALLAAGCGRGQGYLYARPMPADQLGRFLREAPLMRPAHAPLSAS